MESRIVADAELVGVSVTDGLVVCLACWGLTAFETDGVEESLVQISV